MSLLKVSSSPHQVSGATTQKIMLTVIIALLPALIASAVLFGYRAVALTAVTTASCVLFEWLFDLIMKKPATVGDLSAIVTGMLLAFNMPVTLPYYMAVIGAFAAIVVAKMFFGGIGQNIANPAIVGRIVLTLSFASYMTNFTEPFKGYGADAVASATPLAAEKGVYSLTDLLLGNHGGTLGETCAIALLIGFVILVFTRVISPVIPCCFVGTYALCSLIAGQDVLYMTLSGGLLLGAIFMATDYTTSPVTFKGRIIFAIGCGLLTFVIRTFGSMTEGVSFAILIMNLLVPLIERYTVPKPFGTVKQKKEADAK